MGYLKERHGMTMLPGIPKEGQCPECGVFHTPDQPHNRDALRYQYAFYDAYGRWRRGLMPCRIALMTLKRVGRENLKRVASTLAKQLN